MFEYISPDGTALPENEVIKLAKESFTDINTYIKKNKLTIRPKQKKKPEVKKEVAKPIVKKEIEEVVEKPEVKLSKAEINKAFWKTEIEDPLGIKKMTEQDSNGDAIIKNIKKWEKKPKPVGPIEKEYEPVLIKKDKIGDYLTSSLRTEKAVETAFGREEEEGVDFLKKLYAGIPNLTFEETTSLGGDISNVFDAVKAVYTDPITGKKIESETLEFDISALNASKKDRPQIANKNADILKDFFNKTLKTEDLSKNKYLQDITKLNYNKQVAKAITPEFKAKVDEEFEAPDLFVTRKEVYKGTSVGGGFAMGTAGGGSYTIRPYEKELNDAKRQILKDTPKISKEELQIEAERFTRDLLKNKAINDKKALVAEEVISKDPSMQANLYVGSLLANKEAVDVQNKSSVKLKIAETKAININSLAAESIDIFNGVPKSEAELANMVRKFENVGIIFDPLDSEIVTLKNGQQVNKGFLNAYSKLREQYKINNSYATTAFKEQQDNLQKLEDTDIFASAASKNYDLSEKYLTNVGIGFSDLAVGGAYFTAKVLDIATPFSYAGDAISKMIYGKEAETASERLDKWAVNYTEAAADIRNSYTRDVSFDDAFSSGSNFGKFAAQEITSQIPILVAMVASGGAATAVVGVTSAGTKMADMQTEIASGEASYSKTELWLKSIGYGGAEAGFSALTTIPILKRAKTSLGKTSGVDVVDNSMKAYFKEKTPGFIFDQFLESSGEVGTQMTQNIIDGRPVMENTAHAGFSGFGMGTVISGVPYTKGLYLSAFSDYNSKEGIRSLEKEFNDLGKKFEVSQNPEEKKALGALMDEKAAERDLAIEKQQKLINNNLRSGVAQSIISIEGKKAKLQNRAKEVLDDKNITPENKELIIKNLRKEFNKFENAKQKALDPSNMMQDLSQFKVLEVDNPDRYNDLIDRAKTQIGADMTVKPDDDKVQKTAYDLYLKQEIDINIENAGKVEGAAITSFETKKEAIDYIKANEDLSDANKADAIYEINEGADGFNATGVGQVLIKENMFANQRTQIATHEVGHYVTDLLLKNNPEAFVPIANQLLLTTKKLDSTLYKRLLETTERDAKGNLKATEVVSRFLELVSKGDISFAEKSKKYKGLAGLFGSMVQKTYPDITAFDFKGETDMYNFVVGLGKKISAGTLTLSDIEAGSESAAIKSAKALTVDAKYAGIVSGAEVEVGFSKAKVDEIQKKIDDLEDQLDTDEIDYDTYENRLKIFNEELKKAKLAPEVEKPKVEKPKVAATEEQVVREIIKNEKGTIASDKVQKIYDEKGEQGANEIIKLFKPITAKIVAKRRDAPGFNEEELTKEIELGAGGLFDLIRKFDASKGVPLAAYINKNLPLRAITASRRVLDKEFTSDVETEVNIKATETADQGMTVNAPERPKYKNALESKVLSTDELETVNKKILSVIRTLKSKIDAPVTLNRTVTPLIAEIRDDIGKQLDIDIKTMLGGKKDGVLKKELLRNKRYILENMTTTWLMGKDGQGGIPQAIQKKVNGQWISFPEWVGKKIDRESMATDLAGRTSGAELVRRLPNVFNNVSNEEFLAQIIGPDGNPIRGRKESVSKAMAEEIAFDIIKADIEKEGPIYNALKANQERQGVAINESFGNEFAKQSDRGNIKFSLTSKRDLKWEDDGVIGVKAGFKVNNEDFNIYLTNIGYQGLPDKVTDILYNLIDKTGLDEELVLNSLDGQSMNLQFARGEEDYDISGTAKGKASEILSIVINGTIDYAKANDTKSFIFVASEPSRVRLYNTISKLIANKLGWFEANENGVYIVSKIFPTGEESNWDNMPSIIQNIVNKVDKPYNKNAANIKFSKTLNSKFNDILKENVGLDPNETFSDILAKRKGTAIGKYRFFVPPSAADFELLLYDFLGRGKVGERQYKFFVKALLEPYSNGIALIDAAKQSIKNDYAALKKAFPDVNKKLGKLTPDGNFTYDQALRVSMWNSMGVEIPGLDQTDITSMVDFVNNDASLSAFKAGLIATGRQGNGWVEPSEYWDSETIISDLHNITEKVGRKKYLTEFIDNSKEIFTPENLNRIETIYGSNFRSSLEDILYRMANGTNRESGPGRINAAWLNWINNSTAAIMFFNTKSALLQTIGSINYLNWRENNPLSAAKAFANQPQYWKDFAKIFNSDKIKERRAGLKEDVSSAEIANAAEGTKNKANAVISYLLKKGFMPTQIADSFAIAMGGASFYRNKVNAYVNQGMELDEAEAQAWKDFSKVTDETQQSGDPRDISQQQASVAGRLVLAFQNTPMQQARLIKKSALDLINGRGDAKTHISKIVYYTAVQNIIFGALQSALFTVIFDDEDEDEEKAKKKTAQEKWIDIANGICDTLLRGSGLGGAIIATVKNVAKRYLEEEEKGFKADYGKVLIEAANIAPPLGSKFQKAFGAMRTAEFEKDVIKERGWSVTQDGRLNLSPIYSVTGQAVEAATNLPLNRLVTKVENVSEALDSRNKSWQRIAIALGYKPYIVGAKNEEADIIKAKAKVQRKEEGKIKARETRERKKRIYESLSYTEQAKIDEAEELRKEKLEDERERLEK